MLPRLKPGWFMRSEVRAAAQRVEVAETIA